MRSFSTNQRRLDPVSVESPCDTRRNLESQIPNLKIWKSINLKSIPQTPRRLFGPALRAIRSRERGKAHGFFISSPGSVYGPPRGANILRGFGCEFEAALMSRLRKSEERTHGPVFHESRMTPKYIYILSGEGRAGAFCFRSSARPAPSCAGGSSRGRHEGTRTRGHEDTPSCAGSRGGAGWCST